MKNKDNHIVTNDSLVYPALKPIVINEREEIQEIIGHPPSWILQWGILILACTVVILIYLSWLIKYPDVLPATVMLTTEHPVIRVVAKASGKLEQLFVSDQALVIENQVIALLESNAKWQDIQDLQNLVRRVNQKDDLFILKIPENLSVGELQATYTQLVQQLKELQYLQQQPTEQLKIETANQQILHYEQLNQNLERQIQIFKDELKLVLNNYERIKQLHQTEASSLSELENAEATLLQHQRQLESMEAQTLNHRINVAQLRTQIADIKQNRKDALQSGQLAIEEICQQLQNNLAAWEQLYVIKAPINGQINMNKIWSAQQYVQANMEIFTIVPLEGAGETIAKAMMPTLGIGKIRIGMDANIYLDGFPKEEYGLLKAKVKKIALLPEAASQEPNNVNYFIELGIQNGMTTTYKKTIAFKQEMPGTAEIITENHSILDRIFNQLLNILKNN